MVASGRWSHTSADDSVTTILIGTTVRIELLCVAGIVLRVVGFLEFCGGLDASRSMSLITVSTNRLECLLGLLGAVASLYLKRWCLAHLESRFKF